MTKIMPPQRRVGLLHRDRLANFIHDHVNRKLLLISASPGYGKTSLLIDFIQDTDLPTCWYAMDPSDGDPSNFITYLIASIVEAFPALEQDVLIPMLESVSPELDVENMLQTLVNAIQEKIAEYFVILIDDFQFAAANETILDMVNWFLDHQPDNCCLVLASRVMPDLPYLKLTAKQEIAGLGSEDLAFTPEEIQAYLQQNHNLQVSMDEARQLARETEGWITGILLGTHSLWKGLIRSITAAKAKDEQIFDYMAQEIFDQQTDEIQYFLKATSIFSNMTPGFCNQLLEIGNAAQLLEHLEQANLFVLRLSGEEKTYRYHALFQDFLRKQFEPDGEQDKAALHRKAGQLLLQSGDWERALQHFLAAGSSEDAAALIKEHMESTYRAGLLVSLTRWLDALGPKQLSGDTALLIMRGRLYRQEGDFDSALALYQQARQLYIDQGDHKGELEIQIHEALIHRYRGAIKEAKVLTESVLASANAGALDPAMRAQAHRIIGEYHHLAGELPDAKSEFRLSLKLYEDSGDRYHEAALLQALGTTARLMGNPLEAEGHYLKALSILKKLGNRWRIAEMQNNIGVGYYYHGDYDKAREIFQQALAEAHAVGHRRTEALIQASLGDLHADIREVGEAQRYYEASLEGVRAANDQLLEVYNLCALANLYRVDQAWEHALSLLDQADRLAGSKESGYLPGLVALSRGMLHHDRSQLKQASKVLEAAIQMLTDAGEQRELTKAHLWQANTLFRQEKLEEAFEQLNLAMQRSKEIKHPHLLVVDGSRMMTFLERANSEGGIDGVDQLLIRVHQFNLSITSEPVRKISPDVMSPRVEVITFGEATVKVDGQAIPHTDWGGPLVSELFLYLFENEPVRREVILDAFWPEYSAEKAQSVFHASLYRMRRILPKGIIRYDNANEVYVVEKDIDHWYDARAFLDLIERARTEREPEHLLEQALGVYRGEYLPTIYSDWCIERREMYQRTFIDGLTTLAGLKVKNGRFDQAVSLYQRAVEVEPFQEEFHRQVMQMLSDGGRHAEAMRHYADFTEMLRKEMNVPPASKTKDLFEAIQEKANGSL